MAVTKDFLENYQQKYIMPFSTGSVDLNDANFYENAFKMVTKISKAKRAWVRIEQILPDEKHKLSSILMLP